MRKKRRGFSLRRLRYGKEIFAFFIIVIAIIAISKTFVPRNCEDFSCFGERMEKCSPTTFVNEDSDASWKYTIKGLRRNECVIEVDLLNAKNGDLGLRNLEGSSMVCSSEKGLIGYPEKNMDNCHGELKEGLQKLVIDRLYDYVVSNLGDIREELLF